MSFFQFSVTHIFIHCFCKFSSLLQEAYRDQGHLVVVQVWMQWVVTVSHTRAALSVRLVDLKNVYRTGEFEHSPKQIGVSYSASRQSTFKERQKQMRPAGDLSAEQRLCRQSCELIFDFSKFFFPVYIFRLTC